jgi:copper chaperone CopZ
VFSSKFKVLVLSLMVLGAATSAYACGDEKKDNSQASLTSTEGSGCGSKMSKAEVAAKIASGECKGAKHSNVSLVAMGGDHCGTSAKSASKMANCTYGENSVTFAGACPAGYDADFSFAVAGAECQGTGTAAAKAIKSLKGVASVTVDYDKHMAYVCADKRAVNQKSIAKSLKNAGFDEVKFVSASKENCAKSHGKIDA